MWADYFVTACRTAKGFSVLLIPREAGIETSQIKTSYSTAAATSLGRSPRADSETEKPFG